MNGRPIGSRWNKITITKDRVYTYLSISASVTILLTY